jgi:RNA polymerase sigma factor (sigma-70 family)
MTTSRTNLDNPRTIQVNGRSYGWEDHAGLDPSACLEVEGFIRKRAWMHATRVRMAGIEVEDLVQEGMAAALQAARRFNPDRGAKYLTYAAPWIESAMKEALSVRRVGPSTQTMPVWLESLDAPVAPSITGNAVTLLDLQADESPSAEALLEALERDRSIRDAFSSLPFKQRRILVMRHGLDGDAPKSLQATAKALGMTKTEVGDHYQAALSQLSRALHRVPQPTYVLTTRKGRVA